MYCNSLMWAEKEPFVDCDEAFVPSLAERISFAALQPVTGDCDHFLFSIALEIYLSCQAIFFVRSLKMMFLLTALTKAFSSFFCLQFKPNYVSGAL